MIQSSNNDIRSVSQRTEVPMTSEITEDVPKKLESTIHDPVDSGRTQHFDTASVADISAMEPIVYPLTNLEEGIVGWDSQKDPENPRNFSRRRKWSLLLFVSAATTISPLASSMFAPASGYMGEEFGEDQELLLAFTVSVFVLGYAIGPVFIAPLSEIYGRRILLSCTNWLFVIWQIGCALAPNISSLIIFRLFAGIGGSGALTIVPGMIADMFIIEERGLAMSIWSLGPLFGPAIGPVCGGFIGQQLGWRWVFWILLITSGVSALAIELMIRETCAAVLMRLKTERLRKELNCPGLESCFDKGRGPLPASRVLKQGLIRPVILFSTSPIVLLLSVYMSFVYGLLYLLFTTIPSVFATQYNFSAQLSGLAFLGIGVGLFIGLGMTASTSDRLVKKLIQNNNGKFEPEMRLPGMTFYSCFIPISFFWYGWSAKAQAHWIVPIVGLIPFSTGSIGVFTIIQLYLIDCYTAYAASAVAVLTATRSLVAAVLPLAGPSLYNNLGLGWGNSLLGFISLASILISLFISKYGKGIREQNLERGQIWEV